MYIESSGINATVQVYQNLARGQSYLNNTIISTLPILQTGLINEGNVLNSGINSSLAATTGNFITINDNRDIYLSGQLHVQDLQANSISNSNCGYNAGIYTFLKGINGLEDDNIFIFHSSYGSINFNLGITCSQPNYSVAKNFSVVKQVSGDAVVNMLANTGPLNGNDFSANFLKSGDLSVILNIANLGVSSGNFMVTLFSYGDPNPSILNAL